jgi:hypothetical protein
MKPNLLFDTTNEASPEDVKKKASRRRRQSAAAESVAPAVDDHATSDAQWRILSAPLGKLDGHYQCCDESCGADALDILDERDRMWLLECCFCGTRFWERPVRGMLETVADGKAFRLRGGRFDGLTFAEVMQKPRGAEYIEWAAAEHPKPAVKEAAKTWLAESGGVR